MEIGQTLNVIQLVSASTIIGGMVTFKTPGKMSEKQDKCMKAI